MSYDETVSKQSVGLVIKSDLAGPAEIVPDAVEIAPAGYIAEAEAERDRLIALHVAANETFVGKYGSLADEFRTL
jgi:hypothetical protein